MISSVTSLVLPDHRQVVSRIMMPLYFGEVPIIFWLLIKGTGAFGVQTAQCNLGVKEGA